METKILTDEEVYLEWESQILEEFDDKNCEETETELSEEEKYNLYEEQIEMYEDDERLNREID